MHIREGIKGSIPIVLGYMPVGIAFGLISANEGMPLYFTIMLSSIVFAGASQFMAVNALAMGVHFPQIIIATFLMNFRHMIMSLSMASRLEKDSESFRPMVAFFVTDESFAVTSFKEKLHHKYILSVQISAYLAWNIATVIGFFVGGLLPVLLQKSMGITLYVLFAALLIPEMKKSKVAVITALIGGIINSVLSYINLVDGGWNLVIAILGAALIGFFVLEESE